MSFAEKDLLVSLTLSLKSAASRAMKGKWLGLCWQESHVLTQGSQRAGWLRWLRSWQEPCSFGLMPRYSKDRGLYVSQDPRTSMEDLAPETSCVVMGCNCQEWSVSFQRNRIRAIFSEYSRSPRKGKRDVWGLFQTGE